VVAKNQSAFRSIADVSRLKKNAKVVVFTKSAKTSNHTPDEDFSSPLLPFQVRG
jgi:hypothetical protein